MPFDPEIIGERLAQRRGDRSLTAIAAEAGIAKSYLAKLERGDVPNPGLVTLNAVARALDITLGDLLDAPAEQQSPGRARGAKRSHAVKPPSLETFVAEQRDAGRPVADEDVEELAKVQFKGKRPERPEDWYFVYEALKRSTGR